MRDDEGALPRGSSRDPGTRAKSYLAVTAAKSIDAIGASSLISMKTQSIQAEG
jgi:hypothetical protein